MADNVTAGTTLAHLLNICRKSTAKEIAAVPEERRLVQLSEGKATPLWLVGHLANTAEFFGNQIALNDPSGAIPSEWRKAFTPPSFGGNAITTNAADYPSWDEVAKAHDAAYAKLIEGVKGLSAEDLMGDPRGKLPEPLKAMISNLQDCLTLNIVHDSHHRGQLALIAHAA